VLLMFSVTISTYSEPISKEKALSISNKWNAIKSIQKSLEISEVFTVEDAGIPAFYIFNYSDGGFVIVSADNKIHPILGYSRTGYLKPDPTNVQLTSWFNSYTEKIAYVVKNKEDNANENTLKEWISIENYDNSPSALKAGGASVPSLFEGNQTSRWAAWYPYSILTPDMEGSNGCVPLAVAQICKYWKHPKQGAGSTSYNQYYEGTTYTHSITHSDHLYNYDLMPFRLTYCGNGLENCDEGSWDILPGITDEQINEVGRLFYHSGLAVNMYWWTEGTYPPSSNWAQEMEDHLGFDSSWTYWSSSTIDNNPTSFKSALRTEIDNGRPVLFKYYRHAVVINGYEDDDYFYMAMGRGGWSDAYYYLFTSDADGVHPLVPHDTLYQAVTNLKPDCNIPTDINITTDLASSTVAAYQASSTISISSEISGTGSSGANIAFYAGEGVELSEGFKIETGAQLLINIETCGEPY